MRPPHAAITTPRSRIPPSSWPVLANNMCGWLAPGTFVADRYLLGTHKPSNASNPMLYGRLEPCSSTRVLDSLFTPRRRRTRAGTAAKKVAQPKWAPMYFGVRASVRRFNGEHAMEVRLGDHAALMFHARTPARGFCRGRRRPTHPSGVQGG